MTNSELLQIEDIRAHIISFLDAHSVLCLGATCQTFRKNHITSVCHETALKLLIHSSTYYEQLSLERRKEAILALQAYLTNKKKEARTLSPTIQKEVAYNPYSLLQCSWFESYLLGKKDVNPNVFSLTPISFLHRGTIQPQEEEIPFIFPAELENNHQFALSWIERWATPTQKIASYLPKKLLSNFYFLLKLFKKHPQLLYNQVDLFNEALFMIDAKKAQQLVEEVLPEHVAFYQILYGSNELRDRYDLAYLALQNSFTNELTGRVLLCCLSDRIRDSMEFAKAYFQTAKILVETASCDISYTLQSHPHIRFFSDRVKNDLLIVMLATQVCSENGNFFNHQEVIHDHKPLIQECLEYLLNNYRPLEMDNPLVVCALPKDIYFAFGDTVRNNLDVMLKATSHHIFGGESVRASAPFIQECLKYSSKLYTHFDQLVEMNEVQLLSLVEVQPKMFSLIPYKAVSKTIVLKLLEVANQQTLEQLYSIPGVFRKDPDVIAAFLKNQQVAHFAAKLLDPEYSSSPYSSSFSHEVS